MSDPVPIIDLNTKSGKDFVKKLEKLKKYLGLNGTGDKTRQHKELTLEQINSNPFLLDILRDSMFKEFELKRISIGNFGRKGGFQYHPLEENYFRVFLHIGNNEIYYLSDDKQKDKMIPLKSGDGFIIPSLTATEATVIVYQDPIRIIYDPRIQEQIPKIRPRK